MGPYFITNVAVFMMVAGSIANSPTTTPAQHLNLSIVPYYINEGDTFWKLAQKNNVTVDMLLVANPLASTTNLQIGQKIQLPTKK